MARRVEDRVRASKYLLDSSVLIDLSLGLEDAAAFVAEFGPSALLIHPAAEAELLAGARDLRDLRSLNELARQFRRVPITASDFDHCLAFVSRFTLSHGVGWPDCLIAATALRLDASVITLNEKHFRAIRGLGVLRPY